jgi:hypothetical protein
MKAAAELMSFKNVVLDNIVDNITGIHEDDLDDDDVIGREEEGADDRDIKYENRVSYRSAEDGRYHR